MSHLPPSTKTNKDEIWKESPPQFYPKGKRK